MGGRKPASANDRKSLNGLACVGSAMNLALVRGLISNCTLSA
jgi:hypothetical protein